MNVLESIDKEIARLKRARGLVMGNEEPTQTELQPSPVRAYKTQAGFAVKPRARRVMSEAARESIRRAQKERWAKSKAAAAQSPSKPSVKRTKQTKAQQQSETPNFIEVDGQKYELAEA